MFCRTIHIPLSYAHYLCQLLCLITHAVSNRDLDSTGMIYNSNAARIQDKRDYRLIDSIFAFNVCIN